MPTYQTFSQGYNRFHFRRAMAKHKKGKYIWRKSKGETSGVMILNMRAHYDFMCKLLLEGKFAQQGLVNKQILLNSLNGFRHGKTDELWPLINLIAAEMWIQRWGL